MNGQIMLFAVPDEQYRAIRKICRRFQINVEKIQRQDYCQPMGVLAGIMGFQRIREVYTGPELTAPMMVFCGVGDTQLDLFLEAYKEEGIEPIGHKAVITATNIRWTPTALSQELDQEHRAMHS